MVIHATQNAGASKRKNGYSAKPESNKRKPFPMKFPFSHIQTR